MTTLRVAILIFQQLDQLDATGPFEVFATLPDTQVLLVARERGAIVDQRGLVLTPNATFADVQRVDVLVIPGGRGQQTLMHDEPTLAWVRSCAADAQWVLSVCTGALILGAAGLLQGRRTTTHWASHHLLEHFGAHPVRKRVVTDGKWVSCAGVTAGIDGALTVVAGLRGEDAARAVQLGMEYSPEPPFDGGTPDTTPPHVVARLESVLAPLRAERLATALSIRAKLRGQ